MDNITPFDSLDAIHRRIIRVSLDLFQDAQGEWTQETHAALYAGTAKLKALLDVAGPALPAS